MDQSLKYSSILFPNHDTSSDPEVSIEPSMPEASAVGLHADLNEAIALFLADRFDAETWRVGVSTDHGYSIARLPLLANRECHDCRAISRQIVFSTRDAFGRPGFFFLLVVSPLLRYRISD
jgi:hypothetical protein